MSVTSGSDQPVVGLASEGPYGVRPRQLMQDAGFELSFDCDVATLSECSRLPAADIVVIAGPVRSRDWIALRTLKGLLRRAPVVAWAPKGAGRVVRQALDRGLDGLVWESSCDSALELTIRSVHAGQIVVPRDVLRQLAPPELTNREKQVLGLVVMGLSNSEIASKLYLTESTVKSHLGTAYAKLEVRSRAEAARLIADPTSGHGTGILAITPPREMVPGRNASRYGHGPDEKSDAR